MNANVSCYRLSIKHNSIGDEGLWALAHAMQTNSALSKLYIWGNHWEPRAAEVSPVRPVAGVLYVGGQAIILGGLHPSVLGGVRGVLPE